MEEQREGLHADIIVHACCACSKLWMSGESLDRLDDNINVDASKLDWKPHGRSPYRCPTCPSGYRESGPQLEHVALASQPEVQLHRCPRCAGLLLDTSTLRAIQSAVTAL